MIWRCVSTALIVLAISVSFLIGQRHKNVMTGPFKPGFTGTYCATCGSSSEWMGRTCKSCGSDHVLWFLNPNSKKEAE